MSLNRILLDKAVDLIKSKMGRVAEGEPNVSSVFRENVCFSFVAFSRTILS